MTVQSTNADISNENHLTDILASVELINEWSGPCPSHLRSDEWVALQKKVKFYIWESSKYSAYQEQSEALNQANLCAGGSLSLAMGVLTQLQNSLADIYQDFENTRDGAAYKPKRTAGKIREHHLLYGRFMVYLRDAGVVAEAYTEMAPHAAEVVTGKEDLYGLSLGSEGVARK